MKKIIFFVEGDGDVKAVPILARRVLSGSNPWSHVALDEAPFRLGGLESFMGNNAPKWPKFLQAAARRPNCGGVLAIFDGDKERLEGSAFCAVEAARKLVQRGVEVGAGVTFSLSVVIVQQEFESWMIAGISSLAGRSSQGRILVPEGVECPTSNLEAHPRGAKEWLRSKMNGGYAELRDQPLLAKLVDIDSDRLQTMRSFVRFRSALAQLVTSIREGNHIATPEFI